MEETNRACPAAEHRAHDQGHQQRYEREEDGDEGQREGRDCQILEVAPGCYIGNVPDASGHEQVEHGQHRHGTDMVAHGEQRRTGLPLTPCGLHLEQELALLDVALSVLGAAQATGHGVDTLF